VNDEFGCVFKVLYKDLPERT